MGLKNSRRAIFIARPRFQTRGKSKRMKLNEDSNIQSQDGETLEDEPTRREERDDVAEPDAPTAEEENVSMNTILDANPLTGVQDDTDDQ